MFLTYNILKYNTEYFEKSILSIHKNCAYIFLKYLFSPIKFLIHVRYYTPIYGYDMILYGIVVLSMDIIWPIHLLYFIILLLYDLILP